MAKPICFMIMPFRTKPSGAGPEAPAEIDFDRLWTRAFEPAIRTLGYEPVRADQDLGALIVVEMIERLALSDLVMADLSIANGNVYYEIGIRHAAARTGCVLLAADWARPLFDVAQMRQVRYPLADGSVTEAGAAAIQTAIVAGAQKLQHGVSPVFEALPGYPTDLAPGRATSFRGLVDAVGSFRKDASAVYHAPAAERAGRALALREAYGGKPAMVSFIAIELISLLRDCAGWQAAKEFIDSLPENVRSLAVVEEQSSLAMAKLGDDLGAIGAFEELVRTLGDSSDRQGMIGGRYKNLHDATKQANQPAEAARYLDKAIEHYERGMMLDLNDYYPASNLARLLRLRNDEGDQERAVVVATVAAAACDRAQVRDPANPWVRPTLLGLLFDSGDAQGLRRVMKQIRREGVAKWRLDATVEDVARGLRARADEDPFKAVGLELLDELQTAS